MPSRQKNSAKQSQIALSQDKFNIAGMKVDVSDAERLAAVVGGGALLLYFLRKITLADTLLAVAGGSLIYQGITNRSMNINAEGAAQRLTEGVQEITGRAKDWAQGFWSKIEQKFTGRAEPIRAEQTIVINKPPEALYAFWRDFENLPRIMSNLESVTPQRGRRSHWIAKGPAGVPIEWDAEITEDRKNEMISWRALDNADVPNEGSVTFEKTAEGATAVRVSMEYILPGGEIGAALAEFFGEEPSQKIEEDLTRFKEAVERGEIELQAESAGQSRGSEGGP
ncbi:MAG TPA: SRPBCC family protein [Candidatus Manganitrophaceae bacterium]|nr:SRPBCC family protein [Candidatus Manganitrophaceae bacterium]